MSNWITATETMQQQQPQNLNIDPRLALQPIDTVAILRAKVKEINRRYIENQYINYMNYVNELQFFGLDPSPFSLSDVAPYALDISGICGTPDTNKQSETGVDSTAGIRSNDWNENSSNDYNNRPFKPRNNNFNSSYGDNNKRGGRGRGGRGAGRPWNRGNNNYGGNRRNQESNDGWNNEHEHTQKKAKLDDGWGDEDNNNKTTAAVGDDWNDIISTTQTNSAKSSSNFNNASTSNNTNDDEDWS